MLLSIRVPPKLKLGLAKWIQAIWTLKYPNTFYVSHTTRQIYVVYDSSHTNNNTKTYVQFFSLLFDANNNVKICFGFKFSSVEKWPTYARGGKTMTTSRILTWRESTFNFRTLPSPKRFRVRIFSRQSTYAALEFFSRIFGATKNKIRTRKSAGKENAANDSSFL